MKATVRSCRRAFGAALLLAFLPALLNSGCVPSPGDEEVVAAEDAALPQPEADDPPTVAISAPLAGTILPGDTAVTLMGKVSDDHDSPSDLVVTWTADTLAEPVYDGPPNELGGTVVETSALAVGTHTLTLTATDAAGQQGSATVTVTINGPPTAPGVVIAPAAPRTGDDLSADLTAPATDPNRTSGELTMVYSWSRNGVDMGIGTSTVSHTLTAKGDVWEVTVSAADGMTYGPAVTQSVTIGNTAPTCAKASLLPTAGTTSTPFECACVGRNDADELDPAVDSCTFFDGTNLIAGQDGSCTLDASLTTKGMAVTCAYTPGDGEDVGEPTDSSPVAVLNQPPTTPVPLLSPATANAHSELTCLVDEPSQDVDGDALTYTVTWIVNGFENTAATTATVTAGALVSDAAGTAARKGDVVACRVRASDGTSSSAPGDSEALTLENAPPVLETVVVTSPGPPATEASTLLCQAQATTDADGDTLTLTFTWAVNGEAVDSQTGKGLSGDHFDKGDEVTCAITADDGTVATEPIASKNTVVIANSLPSLTGASLTPAEATPQSKLTCTPEGWIDLDGDAPEFSYVWYAMAPGGAVALLPGETNAVLYPLGMVPGTEITCEAVPRNGLDIGAPVKSGPATVIAPVPLAPEVTVDAPSGADGVVSCVLVTPAKYLSGEVSYIWTFQINGGSPIVGSATLTGLTDCDLVTCWAKASNGITTLESAHATKLMPVGDDCDDGDVCTTETCAQTGGCSAVPTTGNSCDDGNPCTTGDTCQAGGCVAAGFAPSSQSCDDGLFCTGKDHCNGLGACEGGADPCTTGADGCIVGACDPAQAKCIYTEKAEGSTCSDGNGCTLEDACQAGLCVPGAPADCSAKDDQCNEGICEMIDAQNHACVTAPRPSGIACDDGDFCTVETTCDGSGSCAAGQPRDCAAEAGDACNSAYCDAFEAACVPYPVQDGADCDDGSNCTLSDSCQGGVCVGAEDSCLEEPISMGPTASGPIMVAPLGFGRYVTGWYGTSGSPDLRLRRSDRFGSREGTETVVASKLHMPGWSSAISASVGGVHAVVQLDMKATGCANWSTASGTLVGYLYAHDGTLMAKKDLLGVSLSCQYSSNAKLDGARAVPVAFAGGGHGVLYGQWSTLKWGKAGASPGMNGLWWAPPGSTSNDWSVGSPKAISLSGYAASAFDALTEDDELAVAWASGASTLSIQRFAKSGAAIGQATVIQAGGTVNTVRLRALSTGQVLVVWSTKNGVTAQLLGADLSPTTGDIIVAAGSGKGLGDVAVLSDDSFVAVYHDPTGDAVGWGVMARRFTKTGAALEDAWTVNTVDKGNQTHPGIVRLENDEFVVAYNSGGTVMTRRFDKDGTPVPGRLERRVNETTTGEQTGADAARANNGNAMVVFESPVGGKEGGEILARIVDPFGKPVAKELHLNATNLGQQGNPSVAGGPDLFAVAWESEDGDGNGVFVQLHHDDGSVRASEMSVAQNVSGDQSDPAIATAGPNGTVMVTWTTAAGAGDISARILSADGDVLTDELQVGTSAEVDGLSAVAGHPSKDEWLVVWQSMEADGSGLGIRMRKYGVDGPLGEGVGVNLETSLDQARPTVAIAPDGKSFTVCWEADSHPDDLPGSVGVACRVVSYDDFAQLSTEFLTHAEVGGDQITPRVTYLSSGRFVVAWTTEGVDSDGQAIAVQRFTPLGSPSGPMVVANRTWLSDQYEPFLTTLGGANFLVGWHSIDQDGDGAGVFTRALPSL